jgi:hypothetical protein
MASLLELLRLVLARWQALVLGGLLGVIGLVQALRSGDWEVWVILALGCLVAAVLFAAWRLLQERNAAREENEAAVTFSGGTHYHVSSGGGAHQGAVSDVSVPASRRVEINKLVSEHTPTIKGQVFVDKDIVGPAVVVPLGTGTMQHCGFDGDEVSVLWEIPKDRDRLSGAIALEDCTFLRCRFVNIGLVGPPEFMERIKREFGSGPPNRERA